MPSNSELFLQIYSLNNQNIFLDQLMIFLANDLVWIAAFLVLLSIFVGKIPEKKAFLLSVLGVIFSFLLIYIIRFFFFETRPFVTFSLNPLIYESPTSAAFPSFHTTLMAVPAFAYFFVRSKLTLIFLIFLILTGFARIYVGVHYPFDILGGILTGLLAVFWAAITIKKLIFPNAL